MLSTLAALFLAAAPAEPSAWLGSLRSPEITSWAGAGKPAVLVAAAGGGSSRAAAGALVVALREGGGVRLAMDDVALGELSAKADQEIVALASAFPVERVAVVRVVPGASEGLEMMVAVLYDTTGKALGSFSATPGPDATLVFHSPTETAPESARLVRPTKTTKEPDQAVLAALALARAPDDKPQNIYDRNALYFRGDLYSKNYTVFRGKFLEPLEGPEFFTAIGRQDLADQYTWRRGTRRALMAMGAVVAVGGLGMMVFNGTTACEPDMCMEDGGRNGGIAVGLGLVTALAASFIAPNPIDGSEARKLIYERNSTLERALGLDESAQAPGPRPAAPSSRGLSLALRGSF